MSNVTLDKVEANYASFAVKFDADEVERNYREVIRYYSKRLNIPGFRRGKIPPKVVESRVGAESLGAIVLDELKESALKLAFDQSGLRPRRGDVKWSREGPAVRGEGAEFHFAAPVLPEVKLPPFEGAEIVFSPTEIDDEMRERLRMQLRRRYASYEPLPEGETVQAGARVRLAIKSKFAETGEQSPFENDSVEYELGLPDNLPGFDEHVYGMKEGESRQFEYIMPEDFVDDRVAGQKLIIDTTLLGAGNIVIPEFTLDFIKENFKFENEQQFEDYLTTVLRYEVEEENRRRKQELAADQVLSGAEVLITEDMINPQVDLMVEEQERMLRRNGLTLDEFLSKQGRTIKELREDFEPQAKKLIKRDLVIAAVAEQYHIAATDREILLEAAHVAQRYNLKRREATALLKNRHFVIQTHARIVERKVLEFLAEKVKFVEQGESAAAAADISQASPDEENNNRTTDAPEAAGGTE
ncbi:MAG: trigger factor [bacterium]